MQVTSKILKCFRGNENKFSVLLPFSLLCFATSCTEEVKPVVKEIAEVKSENTVPVINYSVVATYPHDTANFTQGLLIYQGELFESTGAPDNISYTRTIFGPVDLKTGEIDEKGELDPDVYFGEGIAIVKNKLYQLTYKNQIGFIYDLPSFNKSGQFVYQNA